MKIMTAMYTLRRGGAYDRFELMLEAFLEKGHDVHCLSLTPIHMGRSFFYNHLVQTLTKRPQGPIAKLWVILFFPGYSFFWGWREKVDLFVAFGSIYAMIFTLPKLVMRKPMVTFIRGDLTFGFKTQGLLSPFLWLSKRIEYLGLRFSDRILTVNKTMEEKIVEMMRGKKKIDVQTLFNNIPTIQKPLAEGICRLKPSYGIPREGKVLITAGILNRGKNVEMLIRSLSHIGIKDLFLLVAGEGFTEMDVRYRDSLKELARRVGLDRRVIFTGWLEKNELWSLFFAADLFILPSLREGMPNVLLEALGCNLPCMGSDIPGTTEILKYNELLFDPLNDKALIEKIRLFFFDSPFFEKVKKLCQERKHTFIFDWKEEVFQMITAGLKIRCLTSFQ